MLIRKDGIMDPDGKYPNPLTDVPYNDFYKNEAKGWSKYITYKDHKKIFKKLYYYNIILVIAGTGVGKTVIIPKLLAHYFNYKTPIIVATPRQKTTEEAADWASKLLDVPIFYYKLDDDGMAKNMQDRSGEPIRTGLAYVGLKHGGTDPIYDKKKTKLLYCTDSTVKQIIIQKDPLLKEYGGIVIDEAHERSVSIDILIALVTDIVRKRPDFKVIIMSATVNEQVFIDYFKRSGLSDIFTTYKADAGGQAVVDNVFLPNQKFVKGKEYIDEALAITNKILMNPKQVPINKAGTLGLGDILFFITSVPEGEKVKKAILNNMNKYPQDARPYPVVLSDKTKDREKEIAIKKNGLSGVDPSEGKFHRKVIIATNVAESSITFGDPLVYVIETGVEFNNSFSVKDYADIGGVKFIAKANMKQRCGRTGRTCPGYCYRLYNEKQYDNKIIDYAPPKITTTDLTDDYLSLLSLESNRTVEKTTEFIENMIQPYEDIEEQVKLAIKNLKMLGMISSKNKLRTIGLIANRFGKFNYIIGRLVICGYYFECLSECVAMGAILMTLTSLEKIFNKPTDATTKQIEEFSEHMMKYKHDSGDHITALKIFLQWYGHHNRYQFEADNKLNRETFKYLDQHYNELLDQTVDVFDCIPKLKLFVTKSDNLNGGGKNSLKKNNNNSIINVQDGGIKTSQNANTFKNSSPTAKTKSTIHRVHGGYNKLLNRIDNEDRLYKKLLQGSSGKGTIHKGGGRGIHGGYKGRTKKRNIFRSIEGGDKQKPPAFDKPPTTEPRNKGKGYQGKGDKGKGYQGKGDKGKGYQGKGDKGKDKLDKRKQTKKKEKKELTPEEKERNEKKRQILESFTLKDLPKEKPIKLFKEKEKNILACLLYAYTNKMGVYSGDKNNYVVKYSPNTPSIQKTMLQKLGKKPKLIIYHQFMIMDGKESLSMVSEIDKDIVDVFN